VRLKGNSHLTLSVGQQFRVVESGRAEGWRVQVVAYFYALGQQGGGELLAYHWHPRESSSRLGPHLHVAAEIQVGQLWLPKVHLVTGPILLQDVLTLALMELDVTPLRDDWEQVLERTRAA
jgi:hypothetical protein